MKLKFLFLKRFCISHKQKFFPNRFRENYKKTSIDLEKTSIDLETNAKSNKSLDKTKNQQNKSITEKLDSVINKQSKKRRYHSENNTKEGKKKNE